MDASIDQRISLLSLLAGYSEAGEENLRRLFDKFDEYPRGQEYYSEEHRLTYHCSQSSEALSISIPYRTLVRTGQAKMRAPLDNLPDTSYVHIGLYLNCCAVLAGITAKKGVKLRVLMWGPGNKLSHQEFKFAPELAQGVLEIRRLLYETRQSREKRVLAGRKADVIQQTLF